MVKFIHTADWQIGKQYEKHSDIADRLREARLESARNVIEVANEENADAILIAGDLFDRPFPDSSLRANVYNLLTDHTDIPIYIVSGNHDPNTPNSFWRSFARDDDNLVIPDEPEARNIPGTDATILASPIRVKNSIHDPALRLPEEPEDRIRIGLTHGRLDRGDIESEEHIIDPETVENKNLDYLALGDFHSLYKHNERCYYPGTHETEQFGRDPSILLVEIDDLDAKPEVEKRDVSSLNWSTLEKDLSLDGAVEELEEKLENMDPDSSLVRIEASGSLNEEQSTRFDQLMERCRQKFIKLTVDREGVTGTVSAEELLHQTGNLPFLSGTVMDLIHARRDLDLSTTVDVSEQDFRTLDEETIRSINSAIEEKHGEMKAEDVDHAFQELHKIIEKYGGN